MLKTCVTCSTPLVEGAKFCVECGTPRPDEAVILEKTRARDLLTKLIEATVVREIVKPNTFGIAEFDALIKIGDYGQGSTDFDTFFDARPPLLVTVIFAANDQLPALHQKFVASCGQNLLGTIELDEAVIFVSASYDREDSLPNGVAAIADAIGGTPTVLIGESEKPTANNFTFKASEDIVDVFNGAGLVTTPGMTPARYDLQDQVESSVFKYCPDSSNEDKLMIVSVYLGVPAKGMFSFDEAQNQAKLSDENWVIEFSSNLLTPSEFKAAVALFKEEVGGELSA